MAETTDVTLGDILGLIGGELKDDGESSKRFRDFVAQDKWGIDQYKAWIDECVSKGKGAHDPYNRAFQDIVVCLGDKLGFKVTYGRYMGKPQELGYDGLWERPGGECILLEVLDMAHKKRRAVGWLHG